MGVRKAVTDKMAAAYRRGSRSEKTAILDQLCELTGWHRDHAEGAAARWRARSASFASGQLAGLCTRPGWSPASSCAGGSHALPAGKRLAPMLAVLVPALRRDGELELTDDEAALLCQMSAATIDRRLQGAKFLAEVRGRSHTKPGSLLKSQIPIRTWSEWDEGTPGFVEIDLVGHEGGQLLRGVLLHPDDDRHRHGLDGEPLGPQQGGDLGHRGHRPRGAGASPSRSGGSTPTTARSSSTPTCSSTAPPARSPSPGPGLATRTTGRTSSRRTGPM